MGCHDSETVHGIAESIPVPDRLGNGVDIEGASTHFLPFIVARHKAQLDMMLAYGLDKACLKLGLDPIPHAASPKCASK